MKITKKMIIILIAVFLINIVIIPRTYAGSNNSGGASSGNFSISEVFSSVKDFINRGREGTDEIDPDEVANKFADQIKPIGNVLIAVGWAVCFGASIILGAKYATASATGDPKTIGEAKEKLIAFVAAVFVFTAAYPIWSLMIDLLSKLQDSI